MFSKEAIIGQPSVEFDLGAFLASRLNCRRPIQLVYSSELVCGANNGIARGATGQMRSLLAGGKSVVAPG